MGGTIWGWDVWVHNASYNSSTALLDSAALRNKLGEILEKKGIDLREYAFFVHSGSSLTLGDMASRFKHDGVRNLFATVDMGLAKTFGLRGVAKAGGGELDGVMILMKQSVFEQMKRNKSVIVKEIDDMPGKIEYIFTPSSARTLNDSAEYVRLGPDFFKG